MVIDGVGVDQKLLGIYTIQKVFMLNNTQQYASIRMHSI